VNTRLYVFVGELSCLVSESVVSVYVFSVWLDCDRLRYESYVSYIDATGTYFIGTPRNVRVERVPTCGLL
jgi:hypothetical protein